MELNIKETEKGMCVPDEKDKALEECLTNESKITNDNAGWLSFEVTIIMERLSIFSFSWR